jgi:Uma2 family endonuclease
MPNKMERFTQRARRVMSLAQEEAEKFQHSSIGTEHLLLGMLREGGGVASHVLRQLGLKEDGVEEAVRRLTKASHRASGSQLDLSEETKRVMELAVAEARGLEHRYIGTGHLLLGLIRQSQSVAIDIIKEFGVSSQEIEHQIQLVFQQGPPQATHSDEEASPPVQPLVSRAAELTEREILMLNANDFVEVINGEIITTISNRFMQRIVYGNLYDRLRVFTKEHDLGYVALDNLIYVLLKKDNQITQSRIPDLSFIRKDRLSGYDFSGVFPGAPDLAVEIISPFKPQQNALAKIRDYFEHGTEEAWLVYFEPQEIHVYKQDGSQPIRVFNIGDILDSSLFPGLAIPVSDIFRTPEFGSQLSA